MLVVTEKWGTSLRGLHPLKGCGEALGVLARRKSWCGEKKAHSSSSTVRSLHPRSPFLVFQFDSLDLKCEPQDSGDDE